MRHVSYAEQRLLWWLQYRTLHAAPWLTPRDRLIARYRIKLWINELRKERK